jgi:hypothetical protein
LQPDGKILVAGRAAGVFFALIRFDPNGALDQSFGISGLATAGLAANQGTPVRLALQPDGRIIEAGQTEIAPVPGFGVARFLGDDPIADPNQAFVIHVYLDLLQRSPDSGGLMTYTAALDQGQLTRTQVVQAIINSLEYHTLEVQGLFGRLLGRPADLLGLNNWVDYLNRGGTLEQLETIFFGSTEYYNRRGSGTAGGYLQALYGDIFGRPIDPSGAQIWGQALANGASPTSVAAAILASPESAINIVEDLYSLYLRRIADPSGLMVYGNALQQGLSQEMLVAILLSSEEYFDRSPLP